MVARTSREILRWLESLYLTYPIIVPKWDLSNGYAYAEILHAYFPNEINLFYFINGQSVKTRLLNWAIIKQFIKKKKFPISNELMDATLHGREGGAEQLLEETYQLLTNKKPFLDTSLEDNPDFTDHIYQQNLKYVERAHASKSIKDNLTISELMTNPSYAYRTQKSANIVNQSKIDQQKNRIENPKRYDIKPSLAERCLRKPLQSDTNAQDWFNKSFESRSRSATSTTNKTKTESRQNSADILKKSSISNYQNDQGFIQTNEDNMIYKEIILRQH